MNTDEFDWVPEFLEEHRERFRPHDWPRLNEAEAYAALVADWQYALARNRVTREEARAASRAMLANPPGFRREHIPALLTAVRGVRAARAASAADTSRRAPAPDPADAEALAAWERADEGVRDAWRERVVARFPFLGRFPRMVDRTAAGWMHDPSMIPAAPALAGAF
jgi:hypothetical protein